MIRVQPFLYTIIVSDLYFYKMLAKLFRRKPFEEAIRNRNAESLLSTSSDDNKHISKQITFEQFQATSPATNRNVTNNNNNNNNITYNRKLTLYRILNVYDLIGIGLSGCIGSGIFVVAGIAAKNYA